MKKPILISSLLVAGVLGGTTAVLLNDASAENTANTSEDLIAEVSALTPAKLSSSKDETVYVITDQSGNTKSKFIGSTIYNGADELPFNFKITYYLDGQEISPSDLKGKSGHIKIVYTYDSTANYLGKNIPFVALTGLTLSRTDFSNVKLQNGKIVTETSDSYIVAGYSITGMNANLGTDLLPDSFVVEADTSNFKLNDSYTIFTNELIADIDTSKLNSLDSLTSSIYQLSSALDQIIAGSTDLSNGFQTALDGTKALYDGSTTLSGGLAKASAGSSKTLAGANDLSAGLQSLTSYNDSLQSGAATVITTTLKNLNTNSLVQYLLGTIDESAITVDNYSTVLPQFITTISNLGGDPAEVASAKGLLDLSTGIIGYTAGVADAANGAADLASGLNDLDSGLEKLSLGAADLSAGLGSLIEGETKLFEGSVTLKEGLSTFKTSGIDKLVKFASEDLVNFTANVRSSISAASSYKNYGGTDATSVKFIVKTPSI